MGSKSFEFITCPLLIYTWFLKIKFEKSSCNLNFAGSTQAVKIKFFQLGVLVFQAQFFRNQVQINKGLVSNHKLCKKLDFGVKQIKLKLIVWHEILTSNEIEVARKQWETFWVFFENQCYLLLCILRLCLE